MITSPITIIIEYKSERSRMSNEQGGSKRFKDHLRQQRGENTMQNRRDDNIKLRSLGFEFMRFYGSFRLLRGGKKIALMEGGRIGTMSQMAQSSL